MYFLYSSSVVAPIQSISPRASIGFKRFPASIAPSPLPAPTIMWISSMKRMISPSDAFISLRTALKRSSNSPLNLAPATSAPRSSEKMCLLRSEEGTSPRTIRSASPSAIAVLPTPGSPITTGLFFVFLERILIIFLISLSRPITGSSLLFLARSVRSWPYFLSTSYVSSGFWLVTLVLPRTEARAVMNSCSFMLCCEMIFFISESGFLRSASTMCSTETYSSPICFAIASDAIRALSTLLER